MAALQWAPDDEIVVQLAKDLLAARQLKDRARQLVVAALALVDDPAWVASVAA